MIRDESFVVIGGWMAKDLHLPLNDLCVYAMIYGFSQDGESEYRGSLQYIMDWFGFTKPTAIAILKRLTAAGLINKRVDSISGVRVCYYSVNLTGGKMALPVVKSTDNNRDGVVKPFNQGGKMILPNNKIDNIKDSTLACRVEKFADEVRSLAHAKGWEDKDDIEKFISYWSEPNQSKTKMRFEMEKTWDTSRRINTWRDRSSRENGKRMPQPEQPTRPFRTVDDLKK